MGEREICGQGGRGGFDNRGGDDGIEEELGKTQEECVEEECVGGGEFWAEEDKELVIEEGKNSEKREGLGAERGVEWRANK